MQLPKRKPTRLKDFDYSTPGRYFITICTEHRRELLCKIVGDGVPDVPKNILSYYGEIADKYITQMKDFYDNIKNDKYVIMPNHIHLILFVSESENSFNGGTSRTPSPTNSVVTNFISTFKRFCNKEYNTNIWQRSYYDRIIRNEKEYLAAWEYIDTNAAKWHMDDLYNAE